VTVDLKAFPDWHDVVAKNWHKTTAYLYALREPCLIIQQDELEAIQDNRVLVGLDEAAIHAWTPTGSWFLAVILCPGDDTQTLVQWIHDHDADPDRIHFYAHPDTDPYQALEAWKQAGLPPPQVDLDIDSWQRLHKRFGRDLSVQILRDWAQ
jgi:hypothetical protein